MEKIIETTMIPLSALQTNDGQVEGLPRNPRDMFEEDFDNLVKSIQDDPEMLAFEELDVWQVGDTYVVLNGNMRLEALRRLQYKEAPCKIIPSDSTIEQLKAYVIKDNIHYGEWNTDDLDKEWSEYDLSSWGVDIVKKEEKEPTEDEKDDEATEELVFNLSADEFKFVKQELNKIDHDNAKALVQKIMQYYGEEA